MSSFKSKLSDIQINFSLRICFSITAVIRRKIELSPWVVKDYNSTNYSLKVQVNDNTSQVISAFWMGYFEQIYSAEIIFNEINDSSTKITF